MNIMIMMLTIIIMNTSDDGNGDANNDDDGDDDAEDGDADGDADGGGVIDTMSTVWMMMIKMTTSMMILMTMSLVRMI